jgi:hypothetical protein
VRAHRIRHQGSFKVAMRQIAGALAQRRAGQWTA